jgi:DNA invertase Pin-like site-specific DNA recombinase
MIHGYARVSTTGQSSRNQVAELKAAGCENIVYETASGARGGRPRLRHLIEKLEPGDVLMVSRLDRLARSTKDLLDVLAQVGERGAAFRSLHEHWSDTSSAHGRLLVVVLAGMAEFERELVLERTREGRDAAQARGVKFGRRPTLTRTQVAWAAIQRRDGASCRDLGRILNVHWSTIGRIPPAAVDAPAVRWTPGPTGA